MVILGIEKNILIPFLLLAEINKIQPNKWRIVKTKQKGMKPKRKRFAIQILKSSAAFLLLHSCQEEEAPLFFFPPVMETWTGL